MYLGEKTETRDNNFDFLRFVAATLVLFFHNALAYYGNSSVSPLENYIPSGLNIFFIISGFLITRSFCYDENALRFLKKRILRIFPGLILVVLVTAFIVGPLTTTLPLSDYFHNEAFGKYLNNVFLFKIRHFLPGVFENNPLPNVTNGSLWSLPLEFLLYLIVLVLGSLKLLNKTKTYLWLLVISLFCLLHIYVGDWADKNLLLCSGQKFFKMAMLFLIASYLYMKRNLIKLDFCLFIVATLLWLCSVQTEFNYIIEWFTLPYMIIFIAYAKIPFINNWANFVKGDYSYGIYIWGFLIQQLFVFYFGTRIDFHLYMLLTFITTLFVAVLSYHIVEKPMLNLKNVAIFDKIKSLFNFNKA